jgi:hypothetical protein
MRATPNTIGIILAYESFCILITEQTPGVMRELPAYLHCAAFIYAHALLKIKNLLGSS